MIQRTKFSRPKGLDKLIIEAFKSTGYLIVNKTLIKEMGLLEAIVLSNYIDKFQYFQSRGDNFDGWFFLRHKDVMEHLNLKESTVVRIKKQLIDAGILQTRMKGLPIREWISINFDYLVSLYLPNPSVDGGIYPSVYGGSLRNLNTRNNNMLNSEKTLDVFVGPSDFDKFWAMWPAGRKSSKGESKTSWLKVCKLPIKERPTWQRIRAAILRQQKSDRWKKGIIPLSTTWLNQSRWLDDPKELKTYTFDDKEETKPWESLDDARSPVY